ncbi:MAG: TolC family protein, partial [Bdellovibrionales bacterium]
FQAKAAPITLEQAFQSALQKNETAQQSREQVLQAHEQIVQAKSTIYPQLAFNMDYLIQPLPSDPVARSFSPERQTTSRLTLKQPLFRGFREFAAVRQRKSLFAASEQGRLAVLLQLYQQVAGSYLNILALEQDLKNLKEQLIIYEQRVKELRARTRRGESSANEVLTAQSTNASLEAEDRMVQAELKKERENFELLTTLPQDVVLADEWANGKEEAPKIGKLEEYLARIEERPDVKSAREKMRAFAEEVSVAKGGHWPSLDAEGNYYLQRPGFLSDLDWDVRFTLTFPLFEGGLRFSQTREAVSKRTTGELELAKARRQAMADIRSLHEGLKMRTDQLAALKRSTEISEKNYQVLQRDYRRGLVKNIDVQTGLTEYRAARRGYDQARYLAQLELIQLKAAAAILPLALTKEL